MSIDSNCIISITEANRNSPEYRLTYPDQAPALDLTGDEAIDIAAARILERYRPAFEELAK